MKLLVAGTALQSEAFLQSLRDMGHTVTQIADERIPLTAQNLCPADFEGVICNGLFTATPIEQFTSLRYVQLLSAGYDRMDLAYARAHGITVHNARGVYSIPMAEHALCGVLCLCRQMRFFDRNQLAHRWEKHRGLTELYGRVAVIVGCGSVGEACAVRFSALGCRVIGVDAAPHPDSAFSDMLPADRLAGVLPLADILLLTVPLTPQTRHMIGAPQFACMKPGAVLVNLARGAVVDTAALCDALPALGGAVLDVFEDEPLPPDSPLWDAEHVIITPHNSFVGDGNTARLTRLCLENLSHEPI